jgi:sortase (surface protein transpeptidase)
VDAAVQDRGLIAGNRMAAPTNYTDVGWYKYGTVPGDVGTAVLYAHLDNGLGLNGVFKDLDQLSIGDEIDITTASGTPQRFIVSKMESYPFQAVPPEALGEAPSDGMSYISLITCAGKPLRDPVIGYTYDHRLVVYAKLAS